MNFDQVSFINLKVQKLDSEITPVTVMQKLYFLSHNLSDLKSYNAYLNKTIIL